MNLMNGQTRSEHQTGMTVLIVLKQDQRTGKLTKGVVKDILTKSPQSPTWDQGSFAERGSGARKGNCRIAFARISLIFEIHFRREPCPIQHLVLFAMLFFIDRAQNGNTG